MGQKENIGGWKSEEDFWIHPKTNYVVEIFKPTSAGYDVHVFKLGDHINTFKTLNRKPYKNRQDARKLAKKYMALHPKGK